jgi:DNA repair protein RAD50
MSKLVKLGFAGVRSFSPEEEQRLHFQTPITVILGANGTGKTTIVECLRLATTGELPPLVDKGAAFVHDPRLRNTTETKAKIRLLFEDALGRRVTVNRQFQLRLSAGGKHSFSTIETSLSIRDKGGQTTKTSNRCNDINAMAPSFLGVRQAVLENVIFVHQEDSLWPLQDPKKVKERFDDIFEARGYAKALLAIQKCVQHKHAELKILQSELERWRERFELLKQKQRDWRSMHARYLDWTSSLAQLEMELSSKQAAVARQEAEQGRRLALNNQLQSIRDETRIRLEERDRLWRELGEELSERTEELERILADLGTESDRLEVQYQKIRDEREQKQKMLQSLRDREQNLQAECATLANGLTAVERQKIACTEIIQEIRGQHRALDNNIFTGSAEEIGRRLLTELSCIQRRYESEIQEAERAWQEAVQKEQQARVQNETKKQQIESLCKEIAALGDACIATAERLQALPASVEDLAVETTRLKQLQAEKRGCDLELANPLYDQQAASIRERLAGCREARSKLLRIGTATYSSPRDRAAEVSAFQEALRALREQEIAHLQEYLAQGSVTPIVLADAEGQVNLSEEKLSCARDRVIELEVEVRSLNTLQRREMERQQALRERLHEIDQHWHFESEMMDSFKSRLAALNQQLQELEISESRRMGSQELLDDIVRRMRARKACAVCDRPFQGVIEAAHAEATVDQMRVRLNNETESLSLGRISAELREAQAQWRTLEERAALIVQEKRSTAVIRQRERVLAQINATLASARADYRIAEHELAESRQRYWYAQRVTRLREEISPPQGLPAQESDSAAVAADRSLAESREEPASVAHPEQALLLEETQLQKELGELLRARQEILARAHQLHEFIQSTEARITDRQRLQNERMRLESELEEQRSLRAEKQAELTALEQRVAHSSTSPEEGTSEEVFSRLQQLRSDHNILRAEQFRLESHLKLLERESRQYHEEALNLAREQLEKCRQQIQYCIAEEAEAASMAERLAGHRQSTEAYLRNVRDNLRYRRLNQKLAELAQTEEALLRDRPTTDEQLEKDLMAAKADVDAIQAKIHHLRGQRDLLEEQLRACSAELEEETLKQTETQFQALRLQCDTIELACKDLRNYYRALDLAIMRYHDLKMRNINRTLRELWQSTYAGSDIDEIEIRSDFVADSLPVGRRTYHYRVVMRQGDTWLDMRGRCSAGQKVLACILIRLALAENFGNACGVLALDEPTTNLDEDHVKALATSLSMLIQQRAVQRNFQLILITHEERFLDYLHIREHTDSYIYVARDRYGCSQIKERSLDRTSYSSEAELDPDHRLHIRSSELCA